MPILFDTRLVAFHSQHSIQSQDLFKIFNLAKADGLVDDIATYSFDDFLGLTIHLFITTQSPHIREQLALQLPNFGSAVVLPLIKILCRIQTQDELETLAYESLNNMALYPLIIGLDQVLERETDSILRTAAMQWLLKLIQENNQSVLWIFPKLVSAKTWRLIKLQLLATRPYPMFNTECCTEYKSHTGESFSLCNVQ